MKQFLIRFIPIFLLIFSVLTVRDYLTGTSSITPVVCSYAGQVVHPKTEAR